MKQSDVADGRPREWVVCVGWDEGSWGRTSEANWGRKSAGKWGEMTFGGLSVEVVRLLGVGGDVFGPSVARFAPSRDNRRPSARA